MRLDKEREIGRRRLVSTAISLLLVLGFLGHDPTPAAAQSLNEFRSSGVIGEGYDGFVHLRAAGAPAQAKAVVDSVNAQRAQIYAKRAREQGISAAQVGRVYANEIFANAAKGTWFLNDAGGWRQK